MTRYVVEAAPGYLGYRVVAVNQNGHRKPYFTRFDQLDDAEREAQRLTERDSGIRAGVVDGFGQRMGR